MSSFTDTESIFLLIIGIQIAVIWYYLDKSSQYQTQYKELLTSTQELLNCNDNLSESYQKITKIANDNLNLAKDTNNLLESTIKKNKELTRDKELLQMLVDNITHGVNISSEKENQS